MPELTREEKLKLVEKLPQQLQDFLYSEDTGAFLLYLGEKHNLEDDKISLLSKLVGDVILGIVPITSLAQEINSKITSDAQAAMNLAQELYAELLAPVMAAPVAPNVLPTPAAPTPMPTTPAPTPARPVDQYREPASSAPEVVDLRKTPPSPAEAGYGGQQPPVVREGELPPGLPIAPAPIPRPIMPTPAPSIPPKPAPLIEAEPHKIPPPAPKPIISTPRPQYIIRPSGALPTDLPENILDLRKDKGEF